MKIDTLEMSGLYSALKALRLPYNKGEKSRMSNSFNCMLNSNGEYMFGISQLDYISPDDIKLMQTLIKRGDEHAKPLRGILAHADIYAPIDWWVECETYRVGHERLFSASTMHTEGRALHGKALRKVIDGISYGREIHKIDFFSYQTLRRMVEQRFDHRKLEWHEFIEWIKTLPLANELILVGLEDKVAEHDRLYKMYLEEED